MSQFDPVILMLHDRARAAIAGHADDALPVCEALLAALLAALAAPMPAAGIPRTLATKAELMALLSIRSARTIEAMVKSGRIPGDAVLRMDRLVRFDLERVIEALRGTSAQAATSRGAEWARRRSSMRALPGGVS